MVPLIINPIYTLRTPYIVGIYWVYQYPLLKGSLGGLNTTEGYQHFPYDGRKPLIYFPAHNNTFVQLKPIARPPFCQDKNRMIPIQLVTLLIRKQNKSIIELLEISPLKIRVFIHPPTQKNECPSKNAHLFSPTITFTITPRFA